MRRCANVSPSYRYISPAAGYEDRCNAGGRWQSCPDEDSPERWDDCDVSTRKATCALSASGARRAGFRGGPGWAARTAARSTRELGKPLALGRHSLMNGIGVSAHASPEVVEQQTARLLAFAKGDGRLRDWRPTRIPLARGQIRPTRRHSAADLATAMATQPSRVGPTLSHACSVTKPNGRPRVPARRPLREARRPPSCRRAWSTRRAVSGSTTGAVAGP